MPETSPSAASSRPYLSILIYNYDARRLGGCLDDIFGQSAIASFEIIVCDDGTTPETWQRINDMSARHPGRITMLRQHTPVGPEHNCHKGKKLLSGEYYVELTLDRPFDPHYILRTVDYLASDPLAKHAYIHRNRLRTKFLPEKQRYLSTPEIRRTDLPPVSICIYNYNYGRYLAQCLESALAQDYPNVEICFSDNASTDDSWDIANAFAARHPGRISLIRNRENFGPASSLRNAELLAQGKYILKLCSDDAIRPNFISQCVAALESHPEAAFAMVHRDIMDDDGHITPEAPFYDRSCLIQGNEKAAVYMMAAVNPSVSQILYHREKIEARRMVGNLNDRWYGDRLMDFNICCEHAVIYLKDPLLLNRVHDASDGAAIEGNLLQCIGQYVLVHQFSDIAQSHSHMDKAAERLDGAVEKIGRLCVRYALRALERGETGTARRYYHLALAIFPEIETDDVFRNITAYWQASPEKQADIVATLSAQPNLSTRAVSYAPPPGSLLLDTAEGAAA